MNSVHRFLLFCVIVATSAGCATTTAKAPVMPQALDVPPPPARVIVPPEPDPPPPTPVPEPEMRTQKPTRTRPAAPRPDPRAEANRTAKPETPPPSESAKPVPAGPAGVSLEQELPASPAEMARRVRQQLDQAKSDLGRVNYGALNADGKSQYDTAKRFMEQADQALKEKNLVFAGKLAEKAASLAALVGR
jgi:hypothetical protein